MFRSLRVTIPGVVRRRLKRTSSVRHYLERISLHEPEAAYVLRHGRPFQQRELTPEERAFVEGCAARYGRRFPSGACFKNSQQLLLFGDDEGRLRYVEGYASCSGIPWLHGWLTIGEKVIDPTWKLAKPRTTGRLRNITMGTWGDEPREYFGAEFTRDAVCAAIKALVAAGSLVAWKTGTLDWRVQLIAKGARAPLTSDRSATHRSVEAVRK